MGGTNTKHDENWEEKWDNFAKAIITKLKRIKRIPWVRQVTILRGRGPFSRTLSVDIRFRSDVGLRALMPPRRSRAIHQVHEFLKGALADEHRAFPKHKLWLRFIFSNTHVRHAILWRSTPDPRAWNFLKLEMVIRLAPTGIKNLDYCIAAYAYEPPVIKHINHWRRFSSHHPPLFSRSYNH